MPVELNVAGDFSTLLDATEPITLYRRDAAEQVEVDESTDPVSSTATYRITLEDPPPLDHNHRIVDGDGTVYRLLEFENAERIDVLSVAVVRRED